MKTINEYPDDDNRFPDEPDNIYIAPFTERDLPTDAPDDLTDAERAAHAQLGEAVVKFIDDYCIDPIPIKAVILSVKPRGRPYGETTIARQAREIWLYVRAVREGVAGRALVEKFNKHYNWADWKLDTSFLNEAFFKTLEMKNGPPQ